MEDIYKILESMDSVKPGHKDHVKGTDKPSKGKKKYDGPYTKHPFQGKLVGEDITNEGGMKELAIDLDELTDEEFEKKYKMKKSDWREGDKSLRKDPDKPVLISKNMKEDIYEEFEKFDNSQMMTEEQFDEAAGKKDACYHKVKSRYKVWPSAYASGALVKCRKVGAKNWGNSKKK